jgi:hypothetical protein
MSEYKAWLKRDPYPEELINTTIIPICSIKQIFDRAVLSYHSGKIVDIVEPFSHRPSK